MFVTLSLYTINKFLTGSVVWFVMSILSLSVYLSITYYVQLFFWSSVATKSLHVDGLFFFSGVTDGTYQCEMIQMWCNQAVMLLHHWRQCNLSLRGGRECKVQEMLVSLFIYKQKQAPILQQGTKEHKDYQGGVSQYLTCGNCDLIRLFLGTWWVSPSNLEKTIMTANSKVREHQSPSNWEPTI